MSRGIVLGLLLEFGAMLGYEIHLIVLQTLEQTGNRSKAIYKITLQGCDVFKRLLIKTYNHRLANCRTWRLPLRSWLLSALEK